MMSGDGHVVNEGDDEMHGEASHATMIIALNSYFDRIKSEIIPSFAPVLSMI